MAVAKRDIDIAYQMMTNHSSYPKLFIKEKLEDAPSSAHIMLEGKYPKGSNLVLIGRRCNFKVTLYFVIIKYTGSTRKG